MEQDYYKAPEEEFLTTDGEENTPLKSLDPHIRIFILQGIICVAVIIFCLIIKTFFGGFFGEVKTWYVERFNEDTSPALVLEDDTGGVGGPKTLENSNIVNEFSPPILGVLTSSYGYRSDPFTGETAIHNGVDIAAESGTPIKAVFNGTIETSEKSGGDYGHYIVINHGGFKTVYAHCKTLIAKEGKRVTAGDVIATVGSTGRSTGPHLHFEIRIGDVRIDPTPFIYLENK